MRSVKWLLVGLAIGSLPLVGVGEVWAQDWCADEAKVRERLEASFENSGEREIIAQCKQLAVPWLIAALKDENLIVRWSAADALGLIGGEAKDSVPALIDALKDENPTVRWSVISALGRIGSDKSSFSTLIAALENENSFVRVGAAYALGYMGIEAAVPALVEALKDEDLSVRGSAADALGDIGGKAKDSVPALIDALNDENSSVRWSAANALRNIGREAKDSVPALIDALKDENPTVRWSAANALGGIGREAKDSVPALIAALNDENPTVRWRAADALGDIGGEAKDSVPALIAALNDEDSSVRWRAADALGGIGGEAKDSVPALIEALNDEDSSVRREAADALGRIGGEAKTVVPALIAALNDEDSPVRWSAADALGSIGGEAKTVVPALIAALNDEDLSVRREAADALGLIAAALYDAGNNTEQLGQAKKTTAKIHQALKDSDFKEQEQQVNRLLSALKDKQAQMQRDRWLPIARNLWLSHLLIWALLIFAYPKSPKVQTLFFWNPWVRRIMGLWYIGLLLAWVPFLRAKLFAPFKETLLAEAELDRFDTQSYFAGSTVLLKAVEQTQPLPEAIPKIKGQIVLEGESGLGKSMFLRSLARGSDRILVYLNASRCTGGVMEAIQAKLHGPAKDPKFLRDLIYSGAIDICIDGLNEVSADTRAKITSFVESYFKGNIIMTTQPLEWTPPATAKTYILQPLKRSQIEAFLISRETSEAANTGDYEDACSAYLLGALDSQRPPEVLRSVQRILSNPMDLTLVAQMLAAGEKPDLLSLQQQQYELMAAEYKQKCMKPFPLTEFSERVYQLRLDDETSLAESVFPEELRCMGRFKMVLSRQCPDGEGNPVTHWYFRHDKIMEFFIVQTFLGKDNPRVIDHIHDPRFRGVYFLLANLMSLDEAMDLREVLIDYAAESRDHNVSDDFVQLLKERKNAIAAARQATAPVPGA